MGKHNISVGSKVESGNTYVEYDTGMVLAIEDGMATVGWSNGFRTDEPVKGLRAAGIDAPPTVDEVTALKSEADEHGDTAMAEICRKAIYEIEENDESRVGFRHANQAWKAISAARAMA